MKLLSMSVIYKHKMSRKLYPEHKGHGLDAIMRRHGLTTQHRHRAMGDVELVIDYMKLAIRDSSQAHVWNAITN